MIYITTFFAFPTALSSLPKRSIPEGSTPSREFEVRLSGGFAPYAGEVIVYHQGVWGTVCDGDWDENDALVVCRELGYPGVTMATKSSHYGAEGTIKIEMVSCYGNETKLSQCAYKTSTEGSDCRAVWNREAGVICEARNNTEEKDVPKLRLSTNPDWEGAGLVEVYMHGQWGWVCGSDWDYWDAEVVCRQLGFPDAEWATGLDHYFGRGSGPALMAYVDCEGDESSLFHCPHSGEKKANCDRRDIAGVVCKMDKPHVRLVGSPLAHAGFAQIRYYGRWGSFCDLGWGLAQGHVVCRELGYRRALYTTRGKIFEKQTGKIWVDEAQCTGNESSIIYCDLTLIRDFDDMWGCSHDDAGGVICESNEEPGLNETAVVRLQGGNSTHMGRVEIKQHGFWHAVCSIGWDKHDADVVCRQLGFTQAVLEVGHGQFGSGSGPTWLTSVRCYGNETSLDQCVSAGWELQPECGKRLGAGVICKMDNITDDGDVRLRGSNTNEFEGRVEIKLGGVWGTVSEIDWDIRDGHVVCRQLGYRRAVRVYSHSRYGDVGKFWLSDLHCSGNESNLLECPRELNYRLDVEEVLNAGVECTNDTDYKSGVEVRLVGMDRPNAGHVQVKYNGTWGTICERWRYLTYQSAKVICRQLGQGPPLKHKLSYKDCAATNKGAETVWLSDLKCQGFEDSIDECPHRGWGRVHCRGCSPTDDIYKACSVCLICHPMDNITDIAVRLVGSNFPYAGRVEVRYAGVWGIICPRRMNGPVFKVICRQLGFEDVMGDGRLYGRADYPHRWFRLYGEGRGPIWLTKVRCHGNESSLSQCEIGSPGVLHFWCLHEDTLELMCRPKNFTPAYPIRLAGALVPHAGRLEVFYNGSWGTVCSMYEWGEWSISSTNALVACRQLGFGPAISVSISWLSPQNSDCPARDHATGAVWLSKVRCRGNESSIDQCPHLEWGVINGRCGRHIFDACLVCENPQYRNPESTKGPTVKSVNISSASPTATFEIPRASSQTGSPTKALAVTPSPTEVPNTRTLLPIQTSSTEGPLFTSAPSTVGPPDKCPDKRCQNGGSCEPRKNSWECQCLETFAGKYCEVNVGSNAVSIVLKMTLDQWDPVEFKKTLAEILTSHCRLNPCLDEEKNTKTKSQKKSPNFQPDDVIILQGYPKAWQGMSLLNVRFAVKTPEESGNNVIPHEILNKLMVKVAPEIHQRLGHGVAYIDRVEIHSGQISSVPPEASGRNSDEPDSVTSHKYALIAVGVLLGVVCLVAIVVIVLYRRKTKRRKTSLREDGLDEKPGENIRLMSL
ncbi:hypothetical protein ACROYT_G041766 [Oculina patagonica]